MRKGYIALKVKVFDPGAGRFVDHPRQLTFYVVGRGYPTAARNAMAFLRAHEYRRHAVYFHEDDSIVWHIVKMEQKRRGHERT